MRYGIVGSRSRRDSKSVVDFVKSIPQESVVISGGCIGVDTWAVKSARMRGIKTVEHLPDKTGCSKHWEFTKAFHARNQKIAEDCDILVAFVSDDRKGGTEDTIRRARKLGKEIIIK